MTDLNTNYSYNYYMPNQMAYGDGNAVMSLDDKRLQPVKDNLKSNPVGKMVDGVSSKANEKDSKWKDLLITFGLGIAGTVAMDQVLKAMIKNKDGFENSFLGKVTGGIDRFSEAAKKRFPSLEFNWAKRAWDGIKDKGVIGQLRNADPAKPHKWNFFVKGMVTPTKNIALTELLDEAVKLNGCDPKEVETLKRSLENIKGVITNGANGTAERSIHEVAYKKAMSLAGDKTSPRFQHLRNSAEALVGIKKNGLKPSFISKMLTAIHGKASRIFHTGNFSGGGGKGKIMALGGLLLNSYFIGESLKQTFDAPKGEKVSTFAHTAIVDFVGMWALMDSVVRFMYQGIGSLKNLKPTEKDNLLTKAIKAPFRWAGDLMGWGLHNKPILEAKGHLRKIGNGFRHAGRFLLKNPIGGVGRFLLVTMALFPLLEKATSFVSHSLFGKPKALLAKLEAEEKGEEAAPKENQEQINPNKPMITVAEKSKQNPMIEKYLAMQPPAANGANLAQNLLAGSELKISDINAAQIAKKQQPQPQYSYIPSDKRAKPLQDQKNSQEFKAALAKTDDMLADAQKALG